MFRLNLHKRILLALLLLSLLPLILLAINSNHSVRAIETLLTETTARAIDEQVARALKLRAEMVSREVDDFLRSVSEDVKDLALLPRKTESYLDFSRQHRRTIWYRGGSNDRPIELKEESPLYTELTFIGPDGHERLRILNDLVNTDLRDVSNPANTTYRSETYFQIASRMPPDVVYSSSLTGWHISKDEQLRGATSPEEAIEGATYQGVIRFAKSVYDDAGNLEGVVMLSLDHHHLMEFTQHISPTEDDPVVFPPHDSGNYAFMFDAEGWVITHPRYWHIRGLDPNGELVPAFTAASSPELVEKGIIPINLYYAGFVDPNLPALARDVLEGKSGVADVTTEDGIKKILAYAPIEYFGAGQGDPWMFGGVIIGTEVKEFHKPAQRSAAVIRRQIANFLVESWGLIALTALFVFAAAARLSDQITDPLAKLIQGTRIMAKGNLSAELPVTTSDEVGELTESFNTMARELRTRRGRLLKTLEDLRRSRKEIIRERNFKETVFENIESGILTLDDGGLVTSINGPAQRILNLQPMTADVSWSEMMKDWPELIDAVSKGLAANRPGEWSEYVDIERGERTMTFRLALLPLSQGNEAGQILTIEDLTERVRMRKQMARLDRLASLGRLSAGIAHEVRNPLTGISLLLDELHDRMLAQPGDQQLIRRALAEIERLEELVNELLDFASPPKGKYVRATAHGLLDDAMFLVKKQCEKGRVEIILDIEDDLPPLYCDVNRMKQALLNLFGNALDAMQEGGVLRIVAQGMNEGVEIEVSDSGIGIPLDRQPYIFEPFYTSKGEGTGLGLAITHNIVSEHQGRIHVYSRPDQGTTVRVWFPAMSES